jgi:hypothetical protein
VSDTAATNLAANSATTRTYFLTTATAKTTATPATARPVIVLNYINQQTPGLTTDNKEGNDYNENTDLIYWGKPDLLSYLQNLPPS